MEITCMLQNIWVDPCLYKKQFLQEFDTIKALP